MGVNNFTAFWMELVASFILIYVILMVKEPIPIGIVFIGLLYFVNKFSNGALNPAATIAKYLNGDMETDLFIWLVIAQVLGGWCAYYFYQIMKSESSESA